jgi:hypothetical protein
MELTVMVALLDEAERQHASPTSRTVASLVELATGPSAVAGNVRPLGVRAEAGDARRGSFV